MIREYPPILDQLNLGSPITLKSIGGGCIADARVARFRDGSEVFVKTHSGHPEMFPREAEGLQALSDAKAIRIPKVLAVDSSGLALEMIRPAAERRNFFEDFGHKLARLHQNLSPACGFEHDNFIGATPQKNEPVAGLWKNAPVQGGADWPEFFIERRLRYQTRLAAQRGFGHELQILLDQAEPRIEEVLGSAIEPPCLLHGDLWSGNFMVDDLGEPCLIDPAVYCGHREADLAMTRLFGGFKPGFYDAYNESLPLEPGHQDRLPVLQLYHVINHLNLFGGGYFGQAKRILQTFSR